MLAFSSEMTPGSKFCVKVLDFFAKVCYNESIRRNYMFAPQVVHVLKA